MSDNLIYAKDLKEKTFNLFYDKLYDKSAKANQSLYVQYLSECKRKNKKPKSGSFVSEWQRIFNYWLEGKIIHALIVSISEQEYVAEGMADLMEKQTKEMKH